MKKVLLAVLFLVLLLASACGADGESDAESGRATVVSITAEEAKAKLDSDDSIILLDVRTPEEYREGHIPGAKLLPVKDIEAKAETEIPEKSATYIVYCRSGSRSAAASAQLVELGYENIYDLGGINDWPYDKITGDE